MNEIIEAEYVQKVGPLSRTHVPPLRVDVPDSINEIEERAQGPVDYTAFLLSPSTRSAAMFLDPISAPQLMTDRPRNLGY